MDVSAVPRVVPALTAGFLVMLGAWTPTHETPAFAGHLRQHAPQLDVQYRGFAGQTHSGVYPGALVGRAAVAA